MISWQTTEKWLVGRSLMQIMQEKAVWHLSDACVWVWMMSKHDACEKQNHLYYRIHFTCIVMNGTKDSLSINHFNFMFHFLYVNTHAPMQFTYNMAGNAKHPRFPICSCNSKYVWVLQFSFLSKSIMQLHRDTGIFFPAVAR